MATVYDFGSRGRFQVDSSGAVSQYDPKTQQFVRLPGVTFRNGAVYQNGSLLGRVNTTGGQVSYSAGGSTVTGSVANTQTRSFSSTPTPAPQPPLEPGVARGGAGDYVDAGGVITPEYTTRFRSPSGARGMETSEAIQLLGRAVVFPDGQRFYIARDGQRLSGTVFDASGNPVARAFVAPNMGLMLKDLDGNYLGSVGMTSNGPVVTINTPDGPRTAPARLEGPSPRQFAGGLGGAAGYTPAGFVQGLQVPDPVLAASVAQPGVSVPTETIAQNTNTVVGPFPGGAQPGAPATPAGGGGSADGVFVPGISYVTNRSSIPPVPVPMTEPVSVYPREPDVAQIGLLSSAFRAPAAVPATPDPFQSPVSVFGRAQTATRASSGGPPQARPLPEPRPLPEANGLLGRALPEPKPFAVRPDLSTAKPTQGSSTGGDYSWFRDVVATRQMGTGATQRLFDAMSEFEPPRYWSDQDYEAYKELSKRLRKQIKDQNDPSNWTLRLTGEDYLMLWEVEQQTGIKFLPPMNRKPPYFPGGMDANFMPPEIASDLAVARWTRNQYEELKKQNPERALEFISQMQDWLRHFQTRPWAKEFEQFLNQLREEGAL